METRKLSTDRAREAKNDVHPTKPPETAADHEIVWTFDTPIVRATARCNAPADAACRMMPSCQCEEWDEQRDDLGIFHEVEIPLGGLGSHVMEKHRHDKPSDCNICTWLNEGDIEECAGGLHHFELAVTPIKTHWVSPGYDWEPAK